MKITNLLVFLIGAVMITNVFAEKLATSADGLTACSQKAGIKINNEMVQQILTLPISTANASEVEQRLGPACACIPTSQESWACQWRVNLASNGIENTLNVFFAGGQLTAVIVAAHDGTITIHHP